MVFFSLPIFLLILTVPTSLRMYLCPRQHQPHQKSQGQGLRLSFTFGFPVSKYFGTSCCRIQNSTSGYICNDPECNLNLDPQVAADPCATNSLSEFSQSVCPPCNFTEKKTTQWATSHIACSAVWFVAMTSSIYQLPTNLSSSTFYLCGYRKTLVGRSWRWHGGVSHTKTEDPCISNGHLNLLSPFAGVCIISVYGTASVLSYGDIRLPLLHIKNVVSVNTNFHK